MWRGLALGLLMFTHPAGARDVTGVLSAPPEPLTAGAELHVQLSDRTRVLAEIRLPARVTTPPQDIPFTLATDAANDLRLQAAIYAGGIPLWATDGITVPAGEAATPLGAVALHRPVLPGGLVPMRCGDVDIALSFASGAARLVRKGTPDIVMAADPANPARFTDGNAPDTTLTRLGNRATLIVRGAPLAACSPSMPSPLFPLRAQGREPGWVLVADRTNMALTRADGVTVVAGAAQIRIMADGLALFAEPALNLILADGPCSDGRLPYPTQATLNTPGTTLRGCAGDAMALLAGEWTADMVAGVAMPEDDIVTLSVDAAAVAGFAGCNRYRSTLTPDGDGPVFSPPVATRKSCDGPAMIMERAFLEALARVTSAAINDNGELELSHDKTVLIRAYR